MKFPILFFFLVISVTGAYSQTVYKDELGRVIGREAFEKKIIEGPYFGVPGENPGEKIIVYRMPFGKVDPEIFYEKTGMQSALVNGKSLVVIFYPGKDECNSTGQHIKPSFLKKSHQSLLKWTEKRNAVEPVYLFKNPHGLEKYKGIMEWQEDPEGIFEKEFFKYPYPCRSFVVIHPSGEYRAILGEFPDSQIDVALKILNKSSK
ncbi:hypothetical protein [Algoriphagus sp. CAU 1675]|uniref:hypothetical protein n=1 Tax=Algoriphagus sp. CAU 1675 TaxID=3032597 RepID=UPI0023DB6655|nr:hypothetical protein [Algoriphagus sp. CAU 1675]MDF2158499.1 hypothetical protein [Algoriphagus sp. CAU 1675]